MVFVIEKLPMCKFVGHFFRHFQTWQFCLSSFSFFLFCGSRQRPSFDWSLFIILASTIQVKKNDGHCFCKSLQKKKWFSIFSGFFMQLGHMDLVFISCDRRILHFLAYFWTFFFLQTNFLVHPCPPRFPAFSISVLIPQFKLEMFLIADSLWFKISTRSSSIFFQYISLCASNFVQGKILFLFYFF